MSKIKESELIISPDQTIYHLKLHPDNIAENIIVVGDPGRVAEISSLFDSIELKVQNREICTHTGYFNNKRISVLSTGMGPDNIDIVMNELDALVNVDLIKREPKEKHTALNIVRLGTSGALQGDLAVDSFLMSEYGLGLDGMLHFYKDVNKVSDKKMTDSFIQHTQWSNDLPRPYIVKASQKLMDKLGAGFSKGITATAPGFYGPQGRQIRLELAFPEINNLLETFRYENHRICNLEMETSALYGLGAMLGHECLTVCVLIANRVSKQFSADYKKPVKQLVEIILQRMCS
ncbi:MAG: nucleoside phosphorylase [Bacteroidetes bacterium]|nr:nucleoside phosphorylase [Bacteroidota bacterium]